MVVEDDSLEIYLARYDDPIRYGTCTEILRKPIE